MRLFTNDNTKQQKYLKKSLAEKRTTTTYPSLSPPESIDLSPASPESRIRSTKRKRHQNTDNVSVTTKPKTSPVVVSLLSQDPDFVVTQSPPHPEETSCETGEGKENKTVADSTASEMKYSEVIMMQEMENNCACIQYFQAITSNAKRQQDHCQKNNDTDTWDKKYIIKGDGIDFYSEREHEWLPAVVTNNKASYAEITPRNPMKKPEWSSLVSERVQKPYSKVARPIMNPILYRMGTLDWCKRDPSIKKDEFFNDLGQNEVWFNPLSSASSSSSSSNESAIAATYIGECLGNKPHGQGLMTLCNKTIIDGGFRYGFPEGHCHFRLPRGFLFNGLCSDGYFQRVKSFVFCLVFHTHVFLCRDVWKIQRNTPNPWGNSINKTYQRIISVIGSVRPRVKITRVLLLVELSMV